MNVAPCMNCTDRKVGCHSSCESYISFAQERKKEHSYTNEINRRLKVDKRRISR